MARKRLNVGAPASAQPFSVRTVGRGSRQISYETSIITLAVAGREYSKTICSISGRLNRLALSGWTLHRAQDEDKDKRRPSIIIYSIELQ